MLCKNHPQVAAVGHCAGCAEPFCGNCMIDIGGQNYCGSCKVLALQGRAPQVDIATTPCKEASEALTTSIIGLFCFGFILGPMAIVKAVKAKKLIAEDPRLSGGGKATAAIVLGVIDTVGAIVVIIARVSNM